MPTPESRQVAQRLRDDTINRLANGPLYAIFGGTLSVVTIGLYEGLVMLKPTLASTASTTSTGTAASAATPTVSTPSFYTKFRFVVRYSIAQVIPSVVWATQPAAYVAEHMGLSKSTIQTLVYSGADALPPSRFLTQNRLMAIRGAIAGSVLLSQVFSLMNVAQASREAYRQRVYAGKEPPLEEPPMRRLQRPGVTASSHGVVVRLAGIHSDVTQLTMDRESRHKIFPIFEQSSVLDVQELVRDHGSSTSPNGRNGVNTEGKATGASTNDGEANLFPVYWQVDNGRYSLNSSWKGMYIPSHWLFSRTSSPSSPLLLVLEADGSSGENDACSLMNKLSNELDLYEIAQGFTRLSSMAQMSHSNNNNNSSSSNSNNSSESTVEVLRVLLVDTLAEIESGGGRRDTVRQHVQELGLADVLVDCRAPLVWSITSWLQQTYAHVDKKKEEEEEEVYKNKNKSRRKKKKGKLRPVMLETPVKAWFESIAAELKHHGFEVIDHTHLRKQRGTLEGIPMLVYQRTTADTIHTVQQYVARGIVQPEQVCALCPQHVGLESSLSPTSTTTTAPKDDTAVMEQSAPGLPESVAVISSTDIYDRMLRWVRHQALDGKSAKAIQANLDQNLPDILKEASQQQ